MINKINEKLNEYLEFDNNELYDLNSYDPTNFDMIPSLVRIFGGAIRDSIADQPINDVDILCGSRSLNELESILLSHGYSYKENITTRDLNSIYSDIQIISEPRTWMKGDKMVQLIRPRSSPASINTYEENFIDLIRNVDISCCGLSYSKEVLYENYKDAIIHCLNNKFYINKKAKMYSEKRAMFRRDKMISRGWIELDDELDSKRDAFLDKLFYKNNIEFVDEYQYSSKTTTSYDLSAYDLSAWKELLETKNPGIFQ